MKEKPGAAEKSTLESFFSRIFLVSGHLKLLQTFSPFPVRGAETDFSICRDKRKYRVGSCRKKELPAIFTAIYIKFA